ncbi:hypothetical protein BVC80_9095g73 [Macleaya cordata]|uniref:Uncharacterized protein n=1 Tax=Macleaya cordata TaxID=56857 RepID=A0A200PXD8_MACCD|nr:hypothetical protein BVC80_9095g73 [Macleaya cordata]
MQRQSLGGSSPGSKVHLSEEKKLNEDEEKRKQRVVITDEEEEKKIEKHHLHLHRSISQPEKTIHLIPILTIFCLLVLYLVSYDPPQKDLAHIDGFRRISKHIDSSTEISDFGRFSELEKADVLPIRSHRSLHQIRKDTRKSRFHRKIGDF